MLMGALVAIVGKMSLTRSPTRLSLSLGHFVHVGCLDGPGGDGYDIVHGSVGRIYLARFRMKA